MVIDSSAVLALLQAEADAARLRRCLLDSDVRLLSVVSLLELSMIVTARRGDAANAELDQFIERLALEVVPVDLEQATLARVAFRRFGKGRHPAALNLGDCFVYALAKSRGEALLFKGNDFRSTDLSVALTDE